MTNRGYTATLNLRLHPRHKQMLEALADRLGMSRAEAFRMMLVRECALLGVVPIRDEETEKNETVGSVKKRKRKGKLPPATTPGSPAEPPQGPAGPPHEPEPEPIGVALARLGLALRVAAAHTGGRDLLDAAMADQRLR